VKDRSAKTVATDFMCKHYVLNRITHERAAKFMTRIFGLYQLPTSGAHPQTDGLVEQLYRKLKQILSKVVAKGGGDRDELLGPVLFAYRAALQYIHLQVRHLYGRDPRLPTSMDFISQ